MDKSISNEYEEEKIWTPWKIFLAIVLFPLLPFYFIYRLKVHRNVRGLLILGYFIVMLAIYQMACSSEGPVIRKIKAIDTITLKKNNYKLSSVVSPKDVKVTKVAYKSSNPQVASIDDNGLITPLASGDCIILISVTDNHYTTITKKIDVHVK